LALTLAVASGKGGTGKTTLAVALALAAKEVTLLDCDVEEPNVHLFLPGENQRSQLVNVPIPQVDMSLCDACRACVDFCEFNALAVFPGKTLVFPELCHSCGGCKLVCPKQAITETNRRIGDLSFGQFGKVNWVQGRLDVGQTMSPPLIRAVLAHKGNGLTIIDAPPGTSCPMIAAVGLSDYVLLVTEPTPFGLNDLKLAVETLRQMQKPFGVIINRFDSGDEGVEGYCLVEEIEIWMRIPQSRKIAEIYSVGGTLLDAVPEYKEQFSRILKDLVQEFSGDEA